MSHTKTGWYNNEPRFCEHCGRPTKVKYKERRLFDTNSGNPRYKTDVMIACPRGNLRANLFIGQRLPVNNHYAREYTWCGSKQEAIEIREFEGVPA